MNTDLDVAIVGMAGRFPGARNIGEFWRNLAAGVESIARLSDQEILESGVPAAYVSSPGYVKAAPVLADAGQFDAAFFGFSPMEARTLDPQHRILLELAHEALEHAGYDSERYQGRIGVFTGSALNGYFTHVGLNHRLADQYIPTLIGNDKDFLSTRISYKLNLRGPSITIQTACSTSVVAVHLARQSLLTQETDMALAGAISVRVPHRAGYFDDGGGIVSPDGHVRAFDAKANGTVFGSGGGILVLKRLADAVADGDTVHAVIKGSAVNNDGSHKAGYTAPSVDSQADVVVEALANAGVEAETIGYIEAHGSGTPVGDPIEIRALTKAFRTSARDSGYCAIGSVKTNVGHLDAAAGIAGIIKTVLALEHRMLPPSLHFDEPNPEIDFAATPFYVNTRLRAWNTNGPRRAGVMSTGMGGTNAHVVLEEAPDASRSTVAPSPHLLVLSAKTQSALDQATRGLQEYLEAHDAVNMADLAYTLQVGRRPFAHRRCLVCADRQDAITTLRHTDSKRVLSAAASGSTRPVIFLLPGVGDHYVGMAHDLYERWPIFRGEVDRCAELLEPQIGVDIRDVLYPASHSWKNREATRGVDLRQMLAGPSDRVQDHESLTLNQTLYVQPALFTIEYAMARLWQSFGITPDAIVGHSMGEYVAACLSGVLSLEDALRLIATRARLVNELPGGAMLAVMLAEHELLPLLREGLSISLINGPGLCVVAGPPAAVEELEQALATRQVICRRVQNAHAFHSTMLEPIVERFERVVSTARLNEPTIPYISNLTGRWITRGEATSPSYWARHATHTARFNDALHTLWQLSDPILLEAGPGRTLGVLAMQHPGRVGSEASGISSIRHHYEHQSDVEFLWQAVGRLWIAGAHIDWDRVQPAGRQRRIPLPTYPFERQEYWLDPRSIQKKRDPDSWLYVPSWKRVPNGVASAHASLATTTARQWLVYLDECGVASGLTAKLRAAGHHVVTVEPGADFQQLDPQTFTIDPHSARHYDLLIRALLEQAPLPDRVIHAWNVSGPDAEPTAGRFERAQAAGFYSLMNLARSLATHDVGHPVQLFVLSNDVHEVYGTEAVRPEKSTILGPCMVIRQEYPNVRTVSIDVDLSAQVSEREALAELVLGECLEPDSNLFVAFRNGHRWVQTYEPVTIGNPDRTRPAFREGGVYLITGGLGSIGTAISEYLARHYRARLMLVGRSRRPDTGALEHIEELGGEAVYVNADVSDVDAMRGVTEQTHRRFGALHGVIHGAGVVGDAGYLDIKDSTPDRCAVHFQAKAHGVRALEDVLDGQPLDFCLLLSSLTSVLGGIGQGAYASANVYMDAFARSRRRTSSTPWLSVNWDVWRVGARGAITSGQGATLEELGMSADEAMLVMERVLAAKCSGQIVVSTGDLAARVKQWIELESLHGRMPVSRAPRFRHAHPSARDAAPRDETEAQIAGIWRDALGLDAVGIHDAFSDLGGHSLLAIRIVSALRRAFQVDLPVRALFDAPTIAELSRYIKNQIIAEIDALTDEEAQRLVSNE